MPWLPASPGHQHPWYWLCRIGKFLFCMRKDFNYLCHVRMLWIIDIFFMFRMKNVACKGLRHTDFWWIAINALLCWRYGYDTDIRSSIIFTLIVTCIFFRDPKHILFYLPCCVLHVCFTYDLLIFLIVHKILHCIYLPLSYVVCMLVFLLIRKVLQNVYRIWLNKSN